jgi:hypothetical protein
LSNTGRMRNCSPAKGITPGCTRTRTVGRWRQRDRQRGKTMVSTPRRPAPGKLARCATLCNGDTLQGWLFSIGQTSSTSLYYVSASEGDRKDEGCVERVTHTDHSPHRMAEWPPCVSSVVVSAGDGSVERGVQEASQTRKEHR